MRLLAEFRFRLLMLVGNGCPVVQQVGRRCACEKDFVGSFPISAGHGPGMELRHLRYFIAVAEEGSITVAAEKRLHTAQPSLSRQLRDLEAEVCAMLFIRGARR